MAFRSLAEMMGLTSPVPASTTQPSGHPDAECRFSPFGESATADNVNRPHYALGENTDDLNTRMTRDIASPEVGVLTGFSGSSIVIDPSNTSGDVLYSGTLYCGETAWATEGRDQERLDQLFQLLDEDYNEVLVAGSEVKITGITGNSLGDGFVATATTLTLSASVPNANYRIGYLIGTNIGELPAYALSLAGLRGLEELPGEDRPASRVTYADTSTQWHDGTTNPATDAQSQLDKIITDLVSNDGSDRIGATAKTSNFEPLTAGSIEDQVASIIARLDEMERLDMVSRGTTFLPPVGTDPAILCDLLSIAVGLDGSIIGTNRTQKRWVAVGENGFGVIESVFSESIRGPWNRVAFAVGILRVRDVAWAGSTINKFVAVGEKLANVGAEIQYSQSGAIWVASAALPAPASTAGYILHSVTYDASSGYFVAVGDDTGGNPTVVRSNDAINWVVPTTPPASGNLNKVITDGSGTLLAVGTYVEKSTDGGDTWTRAHTPATVINDVVYEARSGLWGALITNPISATDNDFWLSDDSTATTWTLTTPGQLAVNRFKAASIAADGRGLIVVSGGDTALGVGGNIRWTTDLGQTWNAGMLADTSFANDANDIDVPRTLFYIDGRFIQIAIDESAAGGAIWFSLRSGADISGSDV